LKFGENGKALFRLGQAQYYQGKKKDAVHNLRRASQLLTTDASGTSKTINFFLKFGCSEGLIG